MLEAILKSFDAPDETRLFENGKFEIVHIGGMTVGKPTYHPGWKWSTHVAPVAGGPLCDVEHIGLVISGRVAAMEDGREIELLPGSLFYIPPVPHDSWVIGDDPMFHSIFLGLKLTPNKT